MAKVGGKRLSRTALEEHEKDNPALAPPRVQRLKFDTNSSKSDDKSTDTSGGMRRRSTVRPSIGGAVSEKAEMNRRAMDVTRRLSMSNNAFSELQAFLSQQPAVDPKNAKYENSYRMEPEDGEGCDTCEVSEILHRVLPIMLKNATYDPEASSKLSCDVANRINNRMKELDMPRYKYVCNVLIGAKKDQGLRMASRCLWNPETDTFASATYENATLFAVASVHGVYFD